MERGKSQTSLTETLKDESHTDGPFDFQDEQINHYLRENFPQMTSELRSR